MLPVEEKVKQAIKLELQKTEKEHDIKILAAVESGSRAWGFPSLDSDYDVRFIYIRRTDSYLSLYEKKDTLNFPLNDKLDINGWDIKKVLRHLGKSNATLFEWFQSPVIYRDERGFISGISSLAESFYSRRAVFNHYTGLIQKFSDNIAVNASIKIKNFFYILRHLLAACWIIRENSVPALPPPMEFRELLLQIKNPEVSERILELLTEKENSTEEETVKINPVLYEFIKEMQNLCRREKNSFPEQPLSGETLDKYFRQLLAGQEATHDADN